jgi:hypothetical protein
MLFSTREKQKCFAINMFVLDGSRIICRNEVVDFKYLSVSPEEYDLSARPITSHDIY